MSTIVLKQVQLKAGTKTPQSMGQNYHNTTHELVADTETRVVFMRSRSRDDGYAVFPFEVVDFMRVLSPDLGPGFRPKMTEPPVKESKRGSNTTVAS